MAQESQSVSVVNSAYKPKTQCVQCRKTHVKFNPPKSSRTTNQSYKECVLVYKTKVFRSAPALQRNRPEYSLKVRVAGAYTASHTLMLEILRFRLFSFLRLEVGGLSACGLNREMLCKRGVRKSGTRIQTWAVKFGFFSSLLFSCRRFFFFSSFPRSGSWGGVLEWDL